MNELMYLAALILMGAGAIIGDRIDKGIISQPLNPVPLRAVTAAAGWIAIAFFIYGFFIAKWWLPIIGLIALIPLGNLIAFYSMRNHHGPIMGILWSLLGLAIAIYVVVIGT
ncbi:hypothetical protein [Dokdonella sp.]|uniref:hypothetical protein n=1 Tax=Dokdonella sp. TaxID=2291710 RepID=UPI0027B9BE66|nr:hypothetical protein [Dokdonella sp.]